MAARNPIVLDSPSPAVSESPPITPQHHSKTSTVATSSSPALLSISKLVRRPNTGLVSVSAAKDLPQGAKSGFASAACLWEAQQSEAGTKTAERQDEDITISQKALRKINTKRDNAGKLPKRRKAEDSGRTTRGPSITGQSPVSAFAYQDQIERRRSILAAPAPDNEPNHGLQEPRQSRAPSIALSEHDFRPEEHTAFEAQTLPALPVKKARRSAAKKIEMNGEEVAKKPRKRIAKTPETEKGAKKRSPQPLKKSESIILNSDDLVATQADTYSRIEIPSGAPVIKKTKKTTSKPALETNEPGTSANLETVKVTSEKSMYFDELPEQQDAATAENADSGKELLDLTGLAREATPKSPTLPQIAPRRRLSWTPAKTSATKTIGDNGVALEPESADEETTTRSLAQLVSGLGYASGSAYVPPLAGQRSASGKVSTKRRRISLADESTRAPARRRASPGPRTAEKPKKAKAPKKKPQTITDLATKAYRAPEEEATAQPTVSEFFMARKAYDVPAAHGAIDDGSVEPKQPRKPRAKKVDVDGSKPESALMTTKSKKAKKVKIAEERYLANLHTPRQARAQERGQDFLFGTSSQLGVEDSPTYIRDMQMAVRESEVAPASQIDSPKSRARVPNAPDRGTRLSIVQANKDLWCTAARNTDGDVMRLDSATIRIVQAREMLLVPKKFAAVVPLQGQTRNDNHEVTATALPLPGTSRNDEALEHTVQPTKINAELSTVPEEISRQAIVDLCDTSPIAGDDDAALPALPDLPRARYSTFLDPAVVTINPEANHPSSEEIWAIIPSDSSPSDQSCVPPLSRATGLHSRSEQPGKVMPRLKRTATSPIRQRSALQDLDANISSLHHTSPGKGLLAFQQRPLATAAAPDQMKRPRGRPKKIASVDKEATTSPRKRGGLPRAHALAAAPEAQHSKKANVPVSASQPVASGSSGFANIDDISDPDLPITPSPPRRRATSSPPEVQTLDFDAIESPSKAEKPRTAVVTLKPGDNYFVNTIQPLLFPQITNTVKSTAPSNSLSDPSWHEKILLYDPIVLEDFTAWLNEQGLKIELQRLKAHPKTKSRKKKSASTVADEPEFETVKEGLKPWMVQKWCEEKSVCCLWKEGLRGGVRTRY
ncbi:hypothetical protein DOTSEDRAFT_52165 [Dothistroma septosporum NZE10]|uniref:Structure-specific endonuclease subunit SLX4 n=1 Tax=Dothistroma septosporum (strain NZE10 / CBS 128990) TaxID=675120 RepID=N1PTR9_DOTSN|nr:hypothetical protein DOTSEDRAFT_52165 [Dothistroma septosporum NZE10]